MTLEDQTCAYSPLALPSSSSISPILPKPKVTIVDRPCGSGKTSTLLNSFDPELKYLVVTPLLTEVQRVLEDACVPFCEPEATHDFRKLGSIADLLRSGKNVVTTHALFEDLASLASQGLLHDYHIIIDEVPDVVRQVQKITARSWFDVYVAAAFATVDQSTGQCRTTTKWDENPEEIKDTLSLQLYRQAKAGCLFVLGDKFFLWALPPTLLKSGVSLTVYTYLAEGSMLLPYLRKIGVAFTHDRSADGDRAFKDKARSLITIKTITSLEQMKWSYTGQTEPKGHKGNEKKVAKALANLRHREMRDLPLQSLMITSVKDKWYHKGRNDDPSTARASGYSKGSRMFTAKWVANTTRGTNDHIDCTTAIYLWDQHLNPVLRRWLGLPSGHGANDAYALTELIQWLYRTCVRRGDPVTVYMPSARMRRLLERWLDGED